MRSFPIASRVCLGTTLVGLVLAAMGVTYAALFLSDELIETHGIIYSYRFLFQYLSVSVGGIFCFASAVSSSLVMLRRRVYDRLLIVSSCIGYAYYVVAALLWFLRKDIFGAYSAL